MRIFVFKSGLFGDEKTLNEAIDCLGETHGVVSFDVTQPGLEDDDWDDALQNLLKCDRVLTV
jgi:hypothetical protein